VRHRGGRVLSLERDHECIADWRRNIADAGLEETAELLEGDARETLPMIDDIFDVVFLDAANKQYEELFGLTREKLEPGALVIADDVTLHRGHAAGLHRGATVRSDPAQHDRATGPRARVVGCAPLSEHDSLAACYFSPTAERRWSGSEIFKYGQWRYQRVEACPPDLRGIA